MIPRGRAKRAMAERAQWPRDHQTNNIPGAAREPFRDRGTAPRPTEPEIERGERASGSEPVRDRPDRSARMTDEDEEPPGAARSHTEPSYRRYDTLTQSFTKPSTSRPDEVTTRGFIVQRSLVTLIQLGVFVFWFCFFIYIFC